MRNQILAFGLCVLGAVASAGAALTTQTVIGDSNALPLIISERPNAEARGGGITTWEMGVGNHTQQAGQFTNGNHAWTSGLTEALTLSYNGTNLSLTIGSDTISHAVLSSSYPGDDVIIRGRSTNQSAVTLTNILVNGMPAPDLIDTLLSDGGPDSTWLFIMDAFDAAATPSTPWTLTGDLNFTWTSASIPTQSNLNLSIKIADAAIPEPASVAALSLLGGLLLRRRAR